MKSLCYAVEILEYFWFYLYLAVDFWSWTGPQCLAESWWTGPCVTARYACSFRGCL